MSRWVSCGDRLPKEGRSVLTFGKNRYDTALFVIAYWDKREHWWDESVTRLKHPVTHWMPLPRAPETQNDAPAGE